MALNPEWLHRIDRWREVLPRLFYRPLDTVPLAGFTTTAHLTSEQAQTGTFEPMPPGTRWGNAWDYGWFRGRLTLPDSAAKHWIVLHNGVGGISAQWLGGHSLIWVNGALSGTQDDGRDYHLLTREGAPGTVYDLLMECYAGHASNEGGGPAPIDQPTIPELEGPQRTITPTTFGIWYEDIYQLALDVDVLFALRGKLDPNSLRQSEIDQALHDMTLIADLELPFPEMLVTVRTARERLKPVLNAVNGSTAPVLYTIGHGHLDIMWQWPLRETEHKIARTLINQLNLAELYPEHRFIQSQPYLYTLLHRHYPELYRRVQAGVKAGQIIPEGGAWVEPDTNIPSGESLIRQFIHGKRFFKDEFGIESVILWQPDVFGYSGALPQIMLGCDVPYFCTQKIVWAYHGGDPFPYNTFIWEGIDGSEVLAHIYLGYGNDTRPDAMIDNWNNRNQKMGISSLLFPFGFGDGGGGPNRNHLEYLRRAHNLEGAPRTVLTSPLDFFKDLESRGKPAHRYVGELYFQAHRGTYTSQAKTKWYNRHCEIALHNAELWASAARAIKGYKLPADDLDSAWKTVLLNQFHDILPGSSINRVYKETNEAYQIALETADQVQHAAQLTLVSADEGSLTLFNPLAWHRTAIVDLPEHKSAITGDGVPLVSQKNEDDETFTCVSVPACGWTTIRLTDGIPTAPNESPIRVTDRSLENELLRITFNDAGELTAIFDKVTERDLAAGPCNQFQLFKDVPSWFDAWDIDHQYRDQPVAISAAANLRANLNGPLVGSLVLARQIGISSLFQEIRLEAGSRRIDFVTSIFWRERHKLLKVAFPTTLHANEAIQEIQFGHVRRPNHASRPFDADRFEVINHRWTALTEENRGVAILNDSKYGVSVTDGTISLTLLKAALAPDMYADQGSHSFTYSFYAWHGSFAESNVIREGYELNYPILALPGNGGERSLFSVDAPNVVVETVKPAEDGSPDIVVRLYEAKRMATTATLSTTLNVDRATETNMLERHLGDLAFANGELTLSFRPFEVKTIRLHLA
jgi:alpha-mannosidase